MQNLFDKQNDYPSIIKDFLSYICKYVNQQILPKGLNYSNYINKKIYQNLQQQYLYVQAILDYISGMTDRYAVECFNQLITF